MERKSIAMISKSIFRNIVIFIFIIAFFIAGYYLIKIQKQKKIVDEQMKFPEIEIFLEDSEISALLVDNENIYVGGNNGVYLLDTNNGKILKTISKNLRLIYSSSILKHNKDIWIAHDNGIALYRDEKLITYSYPIVPKGRCNSIIVYNNKVIAGFENGEAIFDENNNVTILNTKNGLSEDYINVLAVDYYNNLWIGSYLRTDRGGLSILDENNNWTYFSTKEGLVHKFVTSILPINREGVLVGGGHLTAGGLTIFKYRDKKPYIYKVLKEENGLPGPKVRYLYLDNKDYLWITSEKDGILICDKTQVFENEYLKGLYLTIKNGLSSNEIKVICENSKYIFLAGKIGLNRIEKEKFYKRLHKENDMIY